jgi:hypothetical protein
MNFRFPSAVVERIQQSPVEDAQFELRIFESGMLTINAST